MKKLILLGLTIFMFFFKSTSLANYDKVFYDLKIKSITGEMINFSNIPVKVSINECIEIAKNYSSPKSGKFINGLLDVISLNLLKENKIIKTGKGLIDNK